MRDLYHERLPLYREAADLTVRTDRCAPDECVESILQHIHLT
jgi:shikimate kinase